MSLTLTHPEILYLLEQTKNTLIDEDEDIRTKGGTFRKGLLLSKLKEYEKSKRPASPSTIIYEATANGYLVNVPKILIRTNKGFEDIVERVKERMGVDKVTWNKKPDEQALAGCSLYYFSSSTMKIDPSSMSKEELKKAIQELQKQLT